MYPDSIYSGYNFAFSRLVTRDLTSACEGNSAFPIKLRGCLEAGVCCSLTRPRMADQSVVLQESKSTTGFQLPELDPVDTEDSNANGPDFSQRDSWLEQMPTMKCFASELRVRHPVSHRSQDCGTFLWRGLSVLLISNPFYKSLLG